MGTHKTRTQCLILSIFTVGASLFTSLLYAGATFTNIADDPGVGLSDYQRTPSNRHSTYQTFMQQSLQTPFTPEEIITTPMRHRGIPGVAIFDFDQDDDLDIYVTNGPGTANSLFSNQLSETGDMTFIDVAQSAGVAAKNQDSNGTCFGDIDNDGDHDLMVVGHNSPPKLFQNNGGTFVDISVAAGIDTGKYGMSCVMGDVDQDGRLDIFIARGYSLDTLFECFTEVFSPDIQPNDLFLNTGDNTFVDVSDSSGIRDLVSGGMPPGLNTITWSGALVDSDQDGDLDLFTTDDQCNFPGAALGGFSRGTMQYFTNDGHGNFTNSTISAGLTLASEWMGTSWGDFNHDGNLDFFVTSFGDWGKQFVGAPIALGDETSRWYLGDDHGGFVDPGVGDLIYTPFGWGTVAEDFDNDGDTDIGFFGGLDMLTIIEKSNPGGYLENNGHANFTYPVIALGLDHGRRNDSGAASGDINNDGLVDIVTVSNFNTPEPIPLVPYTVAGIDYGSPWDPAFFVPVTNQSEQGFIWNSIGFPNGSVSLEINDTSNQNHSVAITAVGTSNLLEHGKNNRDGIGAVLSFTPSDGKTAIKPILGGSSHASQNSLKQQFGLGTASHGTLDVLWPGGTRNRLYNIRAGNDVTMPEIPCSYDDNQHLKHYKKCVRNSLKELRRTGIITKKDAKQLYRSSIKARNEYKSHHGHTH